MWEVSHHPQAVCEGDMCRQVGMACMCVCMCEGVTVGEGGSEGSQLPAHQVEYGVQLLKN